MAAGFRIQSLGSRKDIDALGILNSVSEALLRVFAFVLGGDLRIYRQHAFQPFAYRQRHATFFKRLDHAFRRNIPNQRILCERTSAEATDGRINAATTGVVSSNYFG